MTDEVSITQSNSSSTTRYSTPWKSARSPFSRRRRRPDSSLCSDKSVVKLTLCRDFCIRIGFAAVSVRKWRPTGRQAANRGGSGCAFDTGYLYLPPVLFRYALDLPRFPSGNGAPPGDKPQIAAEADHSLFAKSFSADTRRTHWHTIWVACSNSSRVGQEGAIRRFLSLGSHP